MSYSEEKMMILKMLQEGKISSEEAAKLLEALDGAQKQTTEGSTYNQQRAQTNYYDEIAKVKERINEWKRDFSKNYSQKDFDKMVDDFSVKAEKVGKNVANATFGIVDKIADFVGSVVDTGSFGIFGGYTAVEKTFEAEAQEGMNLELEGSNGQIIVKKHDQSSIVVKSIVRSQNNTEDLLQFTNAEGTVSVKPAKVEGWPVSVSYEVFVPAVKFNKIRLETKNGKIVLEDTAAKEIESVTKNAAIDLMGVTSEKVLVDTKNAKVSLNYVIGKETMISTKNALIELKNLKIEKLGAFTGNGKILVENVQNYENSPEITLELRTRNGGIKANMNDMDNKAYKIKARTSNGGINLLVPGLLYRNPAQNSSKDVDAETEGFNEAAVKVNIYAETSNGYIEVVK